MSFQPAPLLAPTPAVASASSPSSGAPFTVTKEKGHLLDDNSAFGVDE
jgi:hypothetical protein